MGENHKRFGTFDGVFVPTILTIIGVILYLRLGWVVGHVGLLGAFLIIILAHISTITTGLAMASMTTNVKIGDGGFYSILSRSLGLEIGGAIGISLYISQTLSIALYIIGFTEIWVSLFPQHPAKLVSSVVLLLILILSIVNAKIAIKSQYIILTIIALSLISFFMGEKDTSVHIVLWNAHPSLSFWEVFAVFFPAVTGISAGAALSGELKDPRKNIPIGMLFAIGIGFFIYIAVALWLGISATPSHLLSDNLIFEKIARWRWPVIGGIMGATLSSAIGSILGAPRILMALGQDRIIPFYKIWAWRSKNGEPRYSLLFTAIIVEISILLWDLNSIAPLLTMFFLITYSMINLATYIEKTIGITSFRPSFKIPSIITLIGGVWCLLTMFLIDSLFAAISIVLIVIFYVIQVRRGHKTLWGDVRGAMFTAIAEWALKVSAKMPKTPKNWKPNLMIPVEDPKKWEGIMRFVKDIVYPKGTLRVFSIKAYERELPLRISHLIDFFFKHGERDERDFRVKGVKELKKELAQLVEPIKKEGIFTTAMVIESENFLEGINIVTQVMKGMFFPPNIMFLTMSEDKRKDDRLEQLIAIAIKESIGLLILGLNKSVMFKNKKVVNLWIRDKSPNQNLATLVSLEIFKEWGKLRLIRVTDSEEKFEFERDDLKRIVEEQRLPLKSELVVMVGTFWERLNDTPPADINIFGISGEMRVENMHRIVELTGTTCLFAKGAGDEELSC